MQGHNGQIVKYPYVDFSAKNSGRNLVQMQQL